MTHDTGGPAFPNQVKITDEAYAELRGMTMRDYFAAKFMQALVSTGRRPEPRSDEKHVTIASLIADDAYLMADAMIAKRLK